MSSSVLRNDPNIQLPVSEQGLYLDGQPGRASQHNAMGHRLRKSTDGYGNVGVVCVSCRHDLVSMRGLLSGFARLSYGICRFRAPAAEKSVTIPRRLRNVSQLQSWGLSLMHQSSDQRCEMATTDSSSGCNISSTSKPSAPTCFRHGCEISLSQSLPPVAL
jgi:hypothetical protein